MKNIEITIRKINTAVTETHIVKSLTMFAGGYDVSAKIYVKKYFFGYRLVSFRSI